VVVLRVGQVALDLYFRSTEADRKKLGQEMLAADAVGVLQLPSQSWDFKEELVKRAMDTEPPDNARGASAKAASNSPLTEAGSKSDRIACDQDLAVALACAGCSDRLADTLDWIGRLDASV
jgi:hypothetical protein